MALPAPRDCHEEYKTTATLYLQRRRLVVCTAYALLGCVILSSAAFQSPVVAAVCVVAFMIVAVAGTLFYIPKLRCPACAGPLDAPPKIHCPECGVADLKQPRFLGSPRCTACDKRLGQGRNGRYYKVRYCHECGSHVHDRGL